MQELFYPYDSNLILKKSKKLRRELLETAEKEGKKLLKKKVAVLGGSTTHDIIRILDLFLLNEGIEAEFYESEYSQYWEDAMFGTPELDAFTPDVIFVHTTFKNITELPQITDSVEEIKAKEDRLFDHFKVMWESLKSKFSCPIIQNNFEYPAYRLLGNKEAYDHHGVIAFVNRINIRFADYARDNGLLINDINYVAASYGLDRWADSFYWHMYKYAMSLQAIPDYTFNVSHIIKAVFGKNKKSLVLDLDNTLWGGIVGDDGPENLEIGQETSMGQVYSEFQNYVKAHKDLGVILNVNSKNEMDNALAGLNHPEGILKPDDFIMIQANWEPKSQNLNTIADTLNLGVDSFVFVDDNPAEREIIRQQIPGVAVPNITESGSLSPEKYIRILDKNGYFETITISEDDAKRNEMYKANALRKAQETSFKDYNEFLLSLDMKGEIKAFDPLYYSRIAQLTNKSNQFNLTTLRCSMEEIEAMSSDDSYITLYGKLSDKFGDNGVVSIVAGKAEGDTLHIRLWLMSCRVLKRDMEFAMKDELVKAALNKNISKLKGYYYPTAKNGMVKNFFNTMGFDKISEDADGNTEWILEINSDYENQNKVIKVNA
ncbi:MAG: HAD-IIIC family phosphatase [Lachnospiraceae bacterium]|nr:HAD-IIIC family phosphatase [Lachnospiraceae bacterium]